MAKRKTIDLSDIKENDLDKTSTFTDLMSRYERKKRMPSEDKINEKEKSKTKDLTIDLKKLELKKEKELEKTQTLELTRQMKFNFEERQKDNKKKKGISALNIIGEINLLCIGYYIYLLVFTNYQDSKTNYMITGGFVVLLVLLFGFSVITNKKASKFFNILNILTIIGFIVFNTLTIIK